MPTGILLNEEGLRLSECSLADDGMAKVGDEKVSSFEFDVSSFRHSKGTKRSGPQLETRNSKLETKKHLVNQRPACVFSKRLS